MLTIKFSAALRQARVFAPWAIALSTVLACGTPALAADGAMVAQATTPKAAAAQRKATAPKKDVILPPSSYLAFGASYMQPGTRPIQYGIGFDFSYASLLSPNNWLEGRIQEEIMETGSNTKPDYYFTSLGIDYLRSFGDEQGSHVFVLAGGGAAQNSASPYATGSSYYFEAGVGVRAKVWEDWGLRPRMEVRYVHDSIASGTNDVVVGLKLEIPPKRQKIVERIVEVEKIVEVPVEVEKIVEKESICVVPTAPEPAPVPVEPPKDSDGDGVPDSLDKCPNTLAGAKVDANGCVQEKQKISLPNIEFEPNKTVLAAGGKDKLEAVVSFLQSQQEVKIDVFGHTDGQGSEKANQKLSEGRARSVMDYLISRGIDASRLSSKGFGKTQPIATNDTAEGRAQNRRVELLLRMK